MTAFFRCLGVGVLLSVWGCAGVDASSALFHPKPQDALVLVTSQGQGEYVVSHGVVVGDGSLVVVGDRVAFDTPAGRRRYLARCITVASPYLGDVADAEVVACDTRASLAVLRVPWRGHPALEPADDQSILGAERMVLMGMPGVVEALLGKAPPQADPSSSLKEETCNVDYVAVREGRPWFIRLQASEGFSDWGVAPMLLPGTARMAALAVFRFAEGGVEGMVLNRVEALADHLRASDRSRAETTADRSADRVQEAFDLYVRTRVLGLRRRYKECAAQCRKLIELRPKCFYGYVCAAEMAEHAGRMEEAERLYREAVNRAPDSFTAQVSYGDFLERQDRPDEALPIFESLWSRVARRPYLSLDVYDTLTKKGEHARCCRFMEEALAVDPNDGFILIRLGNSRHALQEYGAAADAFGGAADLLPDHETVRAHFARNLELAGHLEEAEVQYRRAVEAHPDSEFAHHTFASFLAQHRPERRQEALTEARAALRLHDGSPGDRDKVERLIRDLESRSE
jgi:tetratricopeptide (TPR) repeat protein